jgi:BNR/Asp-box repeat.
MTSNNPENMFWEDMSEKAEWFYRTRGRLSDRQLNKKFRDALTQVEVLRKSKFTDLDPGGGAIKQAFKLIDGKRRDRSTVVTNPYPSASQGFASASVEVKQVMGRGSLFLKLRPLQGAASRLDLRTTTVFVFDPKMRQWNMVEHSGFNERSRYIWAQVHRNGIYAAVALPKAHAATRSLALERFAYYYTSFGVESGFFARTDDYFNKNSFQKVIVEERALSLTDKTDRAQLTNLKKIHRQTLALRRKWRGQLPNGGLPEWHILERLAERGPELLRASGVLELIGSFPWIYHLANRVGRWYPNGPYNINGRVKSLAIHPTNGAILYAGSANGGVWKTTNAGLSWQSRWKFQDSLAIGSIAIAPSAPDTIYASTGEDTPNYGPSYGGVGIYKSTDAGQTWTKKSDASILGARCSKIHVHPTNPNIVYLASETGIHKSTDGGDNWGRVLSGHATDLVIAADAPATLYAGLWNNGVYKTTDSGASWNRITSTIRISILGISITQSFPTGSAAGWIKLAIGRNGAAGSNFVIAKMGNKGANTYATMDGGANWTFIFASEAVDYDEWTSFVAIHPNNPRRIYLGGLGLQYSSDGFRFAASSGSHSDHHQMVFDPTNEAVCFTCCDGGVYRSTDFGATWHLRSHYLTATQLMSLGVSQALGFVAGSATQDQGIIQTDGSMDWNDFGGGNEWGMFVVDPNDSRNIYISPGSGQLRCSHDRGHSFVNPTSGLTDYWPSQRRQTRAASFAHVAIRPGDSNFLIGCATVSDEVKDAAGNVTDSYGPVRRLYYSRDRGNTWSSALLISSNPSRVAYASSDDSRAYAATFDGHFYRSDNGGEGGWYEPATGSNAPRRGAITCVMVDHNDADVVYITYGDINPHVYRSLDGGAHWASISGSRATMSLPDIAASAFEIDPEDSDILYIGTDVGVFRSNDAGATWYYYNDSVDEYDLPRVIVTGLVLHRSTNRLFASTMGRGLYYTYTSGILSLRVLAVSHYFRGRRHLGIQYLRVSDGTQAYVMTRAEVIRRIEAGTNVYTIGADGSRAEVMVMRPDNQHPLDYLMTPPDATRADNLLSLPEF